MSGCKGTDGIQIAILTRSHAIYGITVTTAIAPPPTEPSAAAATPDAPEEVLAGLLLVSTPPALCPWAVDRPYQVLAVQSVSGPPPIEPRGQLLHAPRHLAVGVVLTRENAVCSRRARYLR